MVARPFAFAGMYMSLCCQKAELLAPEQKLGNGPVLAT